MLPPPTTEVGSMRRRVLSALVTFTLVAAVPAVAGGAEATGRIAGLVTDGSGAPLADVCVAAAGALGGSDLAVTETGQDGRYELTSLAPATYAVLLHDCDPAPTYVEQVKEGLVVVSGATTTVDVAMVAGGFV